MLTMNTARIPSRQRGVTLVEVLVTVIILAFGLLGIAAFQAKAQVGSIEAYQRAQAVVLMQDMRARLSGNPDHAADYVTTSALGTADGEPTDCGTAAAGAERDKCDWSNALKGAALTESQQANSSSTAVLGARGCVEQFQASNTATGVCQPGI